MSSSLYAETAHTVYQVDIEGEISSPQLFILRRAVKDAIEADVGALLIRINTPGGRADITIEMMEVLEKFPGPRIAYIDDEAISAGSLLAMICDKVYFAPDGVMGAAAAVQASGEDAPKNMELKLMSYILAKVRAATPDNPWRGDLQRAMMDKDFTLTIDGKTLKGPGELLTLTADEALEYFGSPPQALLSSGTVPSIEALLLDYFKSSDYELTQFELTWSEDLAKWLSSLAPLLLGAGLLLLFIEFKTPGFGFFGFAGISALLIVFASHYIAGLAGYEEVLIFFIGLILLGVELFLFPGSVVFGLIGAICILGSLLWAMADIWPHGASPITADLFFVPIVNLGLGFVIALIGGIALARILPRSFFWDRLFLKATVPGPGDHLSVKHDPSSQLPPIGALGTCATDLFPSGQVVIDGKRFEAQVSVGYLEAGAPIRVKKHLGFSLLVESVEKSGENKPT